MKMNDERTSVLREKAVAYFWHYLGIHYEPG
jgi:hypothetical protein